jgi:hypothetical protein
MAEKWAVACKRKDKINHDNARICSAHFLTEDYVRDMCGELTGHFSRKRLKPTAIPSIHLTLAHLTLAAPDCPMTDEAVEAVPVSTDEISSRCSMEY